jgi:ABC-type sugar transport system ATPase subunit
MSENLDLLELRSITKDFPGTRALENVSLSVKSGEIVALMGENGAGKSTLMKILSGVWAAGSFAGEIRLGGKRQEFTDTRDALAAGISMIHQELAVFPELTVAEHLELDQFPLWIHWGAIHQKTGQFLREQGFDIQPETKVGQLSVGGRQLVEIARALYRKAQVLVFDEPTSALTDSEVQLLYRWIDRLKAEGKAIIYITHRMDEVFHLADRVVVLRDGKNAGEFTAWGADGKRVPRSWLEPRLISSMVGREINDIYPARTDVAGQPVVFSVQNLSVRDPSGRLRVSNFSFDVRAGEVMGLAGLLGAGRSEIFEALFGVLHPEGPRGRGFEISGQAQVHGKSLSMKSPREAIDAGLAYVSEDRKGNGLVLGQSIRQNMVLPGLVADRKNLSAGPSWMSWLNASSETKESEHWARELKLKAAHLDQAASELSGGNQQKIVLAKWLLTEPRVLFLDEPTRGVDIGAKFEIYQWIQKLAGQGIAIVMASSEMPELIGLCHRILVLREGHLTAELQGPIYHQEEIMKAASL